MIHYAFGVLLPSLIVLAQASSGLRTREQVTTHTRKRPQLPTTCLYENKVLVCRNTDTEAEAKEFDTSVTKEVVSTDPEDQGRVLFLLDVPANIFTRLADDPENNRKYHPKQTWEYRASPPAPQWAGKYVPMPQPADGPVWKYRPKASSTYQPKQGWSYNRDVFGRLWRANIQHDTRVIEMPVEQPGVYLVAAAPVQYGR